MNTCILITLTLLGLTAYSDSTVIISTTALTTTTTASALASSAVALGVGVLAVVKGALIAGALTRSKRDAASRQEDEATKIALDVASQLDAYGCVTKLLCEIEATPDSQLTSNMAIFKSAFGNPQGVDVHKIKTSRGSFDLAISFGSKIAKGNPKACELLFEKCPLPKEDLVAMLDDTLSC